MKEKYENEIMLLENSEKSLKDKYMDTRTKLAESEANNQNLKAIVTQMELQLNHSTKVSVRNILEIFKSYLKLIFSSVKNTLPKKTTSAKKPELKSKMSLKTSLKITKWKFSEFILEFKRRSKRKKFKLNFYKRKMPA